MFAVLATGFDAESKIPKAFEQVVLAGLPVQLAFEQADINEAV